MKRLPVPKRPHSTSTQSSTRQFSCSRVPSTASRRTSSLCIALKGLSLNSTNGAARNQAISEPPSTPSSAPQEDLLPNVTLRRGGKSPPKTPSATHRTPVPISLVAAAQISNPPSAVMIAAEAFHERLKAEVRRTMSPTKSPCAYLTKYSDLRNYEAWDVSGRLGSIEQEFARIKSTMENTGT
ncbi:hypothetical protein IMZ48_49755, partial [Candidatus Bathyarchaeota archaeon]|nr:hypothetical protein [Candidatus Bathyarchaeota archaeon]